MRDISVLRGRELSVKDAKLIGSGATSDVYQIDDDTVVKVLKHGDKSDAEKEIQLSKWAFRMGIPTAISFDVADVDGHPGLVYESLGRGNLRNELRDRPEDFDATMQRYVGLLKTINGITVEEDRLPKATDKYRGCLESIRDVLTPEEYLKMSALLDTVPECRSLIHGDCQIKNVRVVKGELFLIDLETLSCGDPIFELSALYCCYKAYSELDYKEFDTFFGVPTAMLGKILDAIFRLYFPSATDAELEENVKKTALLTYMYMIRCVRTDMPGDSAAAEIMYRNFRRYLPEVNDLRLSY